MAGDRIVEQAGGLFVHRHRLGLRVIDVMDDVVVSIAAELPLDPQGLLPGDLDTAVASACRLVSSSTSQGLAIAAKRPMRQPLEDSQCRRFGGGRGKTREAQKWRL